MDMRFYWVRDRVEQKQFEVRWRPGKTNLADYPTKHHTGQHHSQVRPIYLYNPDNSLRTVQGCIKILEGEHRAMRVQHAPPKKQVTWAQDMPTWRGQRCRHRCTPKHSPSIKTIHSPRVNCTSTSTSLLKNTRSPRLLKIASKGMSKLFSFY